MEERKEMMKETKGKIILQNRYNERKERQKLPKKRSKK